jgi:tetratricopeptide (TPR) repeat protein
MLYFCTPNLSYTIIKEMANKNASQKAGQKDELQNVGEVLTRSEQFIENNQKNLLVALLVIVLVVSGVLLFRNSYMGPREKEAQEMIFRGEQYFAADSFELALYGDDYEFIGFEGIIDNYGITKTAKLASAYAGLCYKHMGDYEKAIDKLSKLNAVDIMVSPSLTGAIGDCYVELDQLQKALPYFERAGQADNNLLAPVYLMKAGRVYEALGRYEKAGEAYQRIKKNYPLSQEGLNVDRYIERTRLQK